VDKGTGCAWLTTDLVTLLPTIIFALLAAGAFASETAWPMARGGQDLAGIAPGNLPDSIALLWSFKTGGPVDSSAAIEGGRVFVGSNDKNVYALDLATGKEVWKFATEGAVEATPLILDDSVYIGSADMHLYALDAATGDLRWKYTTGDKILGGANWIRPAADGPARILVGSYDSKLHCVDASTGKAVWTVTTDNYVHGTPAVAGERIVFGGCDGLLRVVSADGKELTKIEAGAQIAGSVAVGGKFAYFGHYGNAVMCANLDDDTAGWEYTERGFPYFSSPALLDDRVLIGGRDKRLHCLDRKTGKLLWDFQTRGHVDSSPVVCGGKVVFGSEDGRLYVLSLEKGEELWTYEIGKPLIASPAVSNGIIVIGSEDGAVYAFGAK